MLELRNIRKTYTVEQTTSEVLCGIDLKFDRKGFVAILGPSGCGKTTLLNIIGGLDRYTSGQMLIDGVETDRFTEGDWDSYRNHRVGFVFQNYNLISHQRVGDNVEIALMLGREDKALRKEKVRKALDRVGLLGEIRKRPNQLSGGQMQRVAIARALVNEPDIILADEPTGALDSESSVNIMEILKEVSREKLVIMVTHNPDLAARYADRIIRISDGRVVSDEQSVPVEPEGAQTPAPVALTAREKRRHHRRTAMTTGTAAKLSFANLVTKKTRSILTTIAGSIGIIGISLVLALSSGFSAYLEKTEENALSQYPIEIAESHTSLDAMLEILMSSEAKGEANEDIVYVGDVLSKLIENMVSLSGKNDMKALKAYLDENFDDRYGFVKYGYAAQLYIYSDYVTEGDYHKVNPFIDRIEEILGSIGMGSLVDKIKEYASMINAWDELADNPALLNNQYHLIGNSRWPQQKDEVVLVLDENNQIDDYMLFALGLKSRDDVSDAIAGKDDFVNTTYTINQLLGAEYKVLKRSDYFVKNEDGSWTDYFEYSPDHPKTKELIEARGMTLKVVGVVRPNEGVENGCINGVAAYHKDLSAYVAAGAADSEVVREFLDSYDPASKTYVHPVRGETMTAKEGEAWLAEIGVADLSDPEKIYLYANSFEGKEQIVQLLDRFGAENDTVVRYTDTIATLMDSVTKILGGATMILGGFSGISLIVSSIMIAIITYTSVVERTKEIGILRSLGARRRDIASIFNLETMMIGLASGVLGVFVTWLLTFALNAIFSSALGIPVVATLVWWHALCMIALSVGLSVLAGIVPSQIAARKEPVVALRSGE